jgi:hypothetical protein
VVRITYIKTLTCLHFSNIGKFTIRADDYIFLN